MMCGKEAFVFSVALLATQGAILYGEAATCFSFDLNYLPVNGSKRISVGNAVDPSNCGLACLEKEESECGFWSFDESKLACYHFNGSVKVVYRADFVSGPRHCASSCYARDFDFTGVGGEPVNATSAKMCRKSCVDSVGTCRSWTFGNGTCLTSSKVGAAVAKGYETGRAEVPVDLCLLFNYVPSNESVTAALSTQQNVSKVDDCSTRCSSQVDCAFWSLQNTTEAAYACGLHGRNATFVKGRKGDLSIVGHKDCSPPSHLVFGKRLAVEEDLTKAPGPYANPGRCVLSARKHKSKAWSYTAGGYCIRGPREEFVVEGSSFISGPMSCPEIPTPAKKPTSSGGSSGYLSGGQAVYVLGISSVIALWKI